LRAVSIRIAMIWSLTLLVVALARVHFRVVTTNVAYNLGKLKTEESALLEKRAALQSELAKITNKKNLQSLSHYESSSSEKKPGSKDSQGNK
jgi:hypothetical protein